MRITESQLRRVVKRLIREQSDESLVKFTIDMGMDEFASMDPTGLTDMILAGGVSPWQKFSGDRPAPWDVEIVKKSPNKITLEFSFRELDQAWGWYQNFTKRTGRPANPQTFHEGLDPVSRSSFDPSQPIRAYTGYVAPDIESEIQMWLSENEIVPKGNFNANLRNVTTAAKALGHSNLSQESLMKFAKNLTDIFNKGNY